MNKKEEIAMMILMSNDDEDTKLKKIEKMDFSTENLGIMIKKLEGKVKKLEAAKKRSKSSGLAESVLNELAAELGKKDGKPKVRYYIPPNPKPFTFDQLGPEQKKSAKKFVEQHKADFNKLGRGEFNTENGFDLVLKGNGVWKIKSQSLNIDKQVETK